MVALMMPFSRGTVRLATSTPGGAPLLDPRYYTDRRDVAAMAAACARPADRKRPALTNWRGEEALPGPAVHDDEQWTAYLHKNLRTYSHYAGTCRIGTDETAVVDPKLRVRGVSGLRVADASVMPSSVSANTNATVYAIAERAADLVRPVRSRPHTPMAETAIPSRRGSCRRTCLGPSRCRVPGPRRHCTWRRTRRAR